MTPTDTVCYLPNLEERLLDEQLAAWQAGQPKMGVLVLLPEAERDAVSRIQQVCTRRRIPW